MLAVERNRESWREMKSRYSKRYINKKKFVCLCLTIGIEAGVICGIGGVAHASILPTASQVEETAPGMGSVPYFRDDAGLNTQVVEGYLYGYWDRRLCRYDLGTDFFGSGKQNGKDRGNSGVAQFYFMG